MKVKEKVLYEGQNRMGTCLLCNLCMRQLVFALDRTSITYMDLISHMVSSQPSYLFWSFDLTIFTFLFPLHNTDLILPSSLYLSSIFIVLVRRVVQGLEYYSKGSMNSSLWEKLEVSVTEKEFCFSLPSPLCHTLSKHTTIISRAERS